MRRQLNFLSPSLGSLGSCWLAAIGGVACALVASGLIAPNVPVLPALGALLAFACVCAAVIVVAVVTPALPVRALAWLVLPVVALAAVALGADARGIGWAALVAVALLSGGTLAGGVIGARIQHPSHLLAVAVASSLADVFSVLSPRGVTAQVVESERWIAILAVSWPVFGTTAVEPLLGVGDIVMCALYTVATRELDLGVRRTALALALAFAAVLAALWLLATPLPALPFLGLAVVLAHPRTWRFRKGEGRTAAMALVVLVALFAVLWLV